MTGFRGSRSSRHAVAGDQHIARVGALRDRHDRRLRVQRGRQILGRMNRGVDVPGQHGGFERAGENPAPTDLGQR